MFNFLSMMDNYEVRKVANTQVAGGQIDTCAVTDSSKSYETGIAHSSYNEGEWVIVELYDTKEEAQKGHDEWVKIFSKKILPASLKDVSTSTAYALSKALGADGNKTYKKVTAKKKKD